MHENVHGIRLAYEKTGEEFYKKLVFVFIEIPKFTKTEKKLKTDVDKWLYILKNLSRLNKIPVFLNTKDIFKAVSYRSGIQFNNGRLYELSKRS